MTWPWHPTTPTASSTIMPSSGLELFCDVSCPSLRCRAEFSLKDVQKTLTDQDLLTFSPPVVSCQSLVRWQRSRLYSPGGIGSHADHAWSWGFTKPICLILSLAIHALWRFSFTTSSAGRWHHEKCSMWNFYRCQVEKGYCPHFSIKTHKNSRNDCTFNSVMNGI